MPCLVIFGEVRTRWRWTAGTLYGRRAVERAMNASIVVIGAELTELPAQIDRMPEERLIQIVAADRPDQSLDVRVRHRSVRHRLDFSDFEDPPIREPSVKAEQGIVIRAEPNGRCFAADGQIEHPAYRRTVDGFAADAEADDAAGGYVDDREDPMTAKEDRFAPKQVHAPEAVLGLGDEREPGWARVVRMICSEVLREDPTHDILVDLHAECMRDLLGNTLIAESGVTELQFEDGRDDFLFRALRTGLAPGPAEENRRRYFRSTSALWNRNNVAGLRIAASLATRRGHTNSADKPSTNRSIVVRGGARRRERPLMISGCLSNRDSAMTERTPPRRVSLARVTINCTARRSKSPIVEPGYEGYRSAQDCSHAESHAMIGEFAPHRNAKCNRVIWSMRLGLISRSTYMASCRRKKRFPASIDCVERNDDPSQHSRAPITDIRAQNAVPIDQSCHDAHR